jgi:ribonuclease PH
MADAGGLEEIEEMEGVAVEDTDALVARQRSGMHERSGVASFQPAEQRSGRGRQSARNMIRHNIYCAIVLREIARRFIASDCGFLGFGRFWAM